MSGTATVVPSDNQDAQLGPNPDVDRIYDNVLAVMPGVTLPLLQIALWNTIEEFAIRGTYFRDKVYWQMAPGVSNINFSPYSACSTVVWMLDVEGLLRYHVEPPALLIDDMPPQAQRQGCAWLALKPVSLAAVAECPCGGDRYSTWFEVLLDGTMFRLYGMPAKPWSSSQMATYHGQRFRQGLNRARDIATRHHTNRSVWRFPYFARGKRKN